MRPLLHVLIAAALATSITACDFDSLEEQDADRISGYFDDELTKEIARAKTQRAPAGRSASTLAACVLGWMRNELLEAGRLTQRWNQRVLHILMRVADGDAVLDSRHVHRSP